MLEVKALYVYHGTRKDGKQLESHIADCDVYSPEVSGSTINNSRNHESFHHQTYALSRRMYLDHIWSCFQGRNNADFLMFEYAYLYDHKRRIYHAERMTREESDEVMRLRSKRDGALGTHLCSDPGDSTETRIDRLWDYLGKIFALTRYRDEHMARILPFAEENIRSYYPELTNKETIKYCIRLGSCHKLESPLIKEEFEIEHEVDNPWDELNFEYSKGKTKRELRKIMLKIIDG